MAKKSAKKAKTTRKKSSKKAGKASGGPSGGGSRGKQTYRSGEAKGRDLVIVESPSKAKTINKYLGDEYMVLASVGHVRDLPSKNPKGVKRPVPGVDLEQRFRPEYEVLSGKEQVIRDLKRAAKDARSTGGDVWFATDLDREGEAIAWHLAEELGIDAEAAKRVVFSAITKDEIERAFRDPHAINVDRVNAQQARRILDRIVGYQVSPLLWKKVARGLSAGRVQSVAVRLVVEREREIRAFVPDEHWTVTGEFAMDEGLAAKLGPEWRSFLAERDEKGKGPALKAQNAWLGQRGAVRAELIEIGGEKFEPRIGAESIVGPADDLSKSGIDARLEDAKRAFADPSSNDLTPEVVEAVRLAGLHGIETGVEEDPEGQGPDRWKRTVTGVSDPSIAYRVSSVETKRTRSRPPAPFITSTMQQAASSRLGYGAKRTMGAAQSLYEGVTIPGEGPVGLITYMRTDSTRISAEAMSAAREYIGRTFGDRYLPEKPNVYSSSNKDAQEAHEAIRPTDPSRHPDQIEKSLKPDQARLYRLIWERFVACQMTPAEWDATTVLIEGGRDPGRPCVFRASGRTLVFDGYYRVAGVPLSGDELVLPEGLVEDEALHPFDLRAQQRFSSPPARYSEASLIKTLESEGIGRPSTYASIIGVIQDRRYVEQIDRRFYATDLGEVVTDKLIEAFPELMDVGYTREMESKLDRVEDEHLDWIRMLEEFYGPFKSKLDEASESLTHAKAEVEPAPEEYRCEKCGSTLVYRFGKNGRFLSCARYPDCEYACPCDRQGRPRPAEFVDVRCPTTGEPMIRKTGRFGPFLTTLAREGESASDRPILNIDKQGRVTAPSPPPLETDLPCPACESPLNLRRGIRGPWLGCSRFPKCKGRGKWPELDEATQKELERRLEAHLREHPIPVIETLDGRPLTDENGRPLKDAPTVERLVLDDDPRERSGGGGAETARRGGRGAA